MILIDGAFWQSVGVESFDGNPYGNQYDFYHTMVVNGAAVNSQYDFFKNSTVGGVVYHNQYEWYKAIGVIYSEPIYDQYTFMQNVTFDGVNTVGNQYNFFKGLTQICRYFTTLNGTNQYATIPTVTLTGDFVIELDFATTSTNTIAFFDNSVSNDFLVSLNGTHLRYDLDGSSVKSSAATFNDGKLHNLIIRRVGTVNTMHLDNVLIGTGSASVATWTIDFIGKRSNDIQFFDGVISSVNINNGQRIYKLNEDFSTTSTIIDYGSDGSNGTMVNVTESEKFCLDGCSWVGPTKTIVIAGC